MASKMIQKASSEYLQLAQAHLICRVDPAGDLGVKCTSYIRQIDLGTDALDSLEIMEGVMRHFYLRASIEQRMGPQADWSVVDALMLKPLAAAEKVARYRHAQLSAVKLAGELTHGPADGATLDELLEK